MEYQLYGCCYGSKFPQVNDTRPNVELSSFTLLEELFDYCISYLVLQNKLFQNLVAENKNNYLTFSMGRCLAGQLWLGASNEVVAKTSAGLQLSEGLFVLEDLLTK